ncbi:MAG: PQQ-binding-like beta-propeller repeat protein, partial [Pontibacterium sp.]
MSTFSRLALSLLVMLSVTGCSAFGLFGDDDSTAQKKAFDTFQSEAELDILWSTSVGDGLGNKYHQFAPAVIGESVFALAAEGVVEALNKGDGQTIWQTDVAEVITSGVGAGFGQVFVASESGKLYALSATSGEQVWVKQLSTEVVAPPQVNSEIVVIQQINGQVVALDRKTGEQRWVYDTVIPRLTLRGTSTPIVTEAVTLASFANGKLAVIRND